MYSKDVEAYRNKLIAITNNSNLTIGCAYYVAKDFLRELQMAYVQDIKKSMNESAEPISVTKNIDTVVVGNTEVHDEKIATHDLQSLAEIVGDASTASATQE